MNMRVAHHRINLSLDDKIFMVVVYFLLTVMLLIVLYPLYFVVVASFSDPTYVNSGYFLLYPKGFTTLGYERVFEDARIWTGYLNTIIYTVCGTLLGVASCIMAGYALSRKDLAGRNIIMGIFVFTMYFSGGLIPFYMVIKSLKPDQHALADGYPRLRFGV
jgi:putative aldouronate transport system permease protein